MVVIVFVFLTLKWISVVTVLRITKWESSFETAESRKYLALSWIALPIRFSSNGYQTLLDEFGEHAAAAYGAWCALCSFAATCEVRGVLATSRGLPIRTQHISRTTGFPTDLFDRLIEWAASDKIGWLSTVSEAEFNALLIEKDAEKEDRKKKKRRNGSSPEDSPGEFPEEREKNTATLLYHTLPYQTLQNPTSPNVTQPNVPGPVNLVQARDGLVDLVDRWKKPTREFLDLVCEIATRFGRLPNKIRTRAGQELDRECIWQFAWAGAEFDRGVVDDVCDRINSPDVQKPKSYADAAMRKLCSQNGYEWTVLRGLVPPAPPLPASKVTVLEEANA